MVKKRMISEVYKKQCGEGNKPGVGFRWFYEVTEETGFEEKFRNRRLDTMLGVAMELSCPAASTLLSEEPKVAKKANETKMEADDEGTGVGRTGGVDEANPAEEVKMGHSLSNQTSYNNGTTA
ncbi:hypothetical protein HK101_011400 [Irineochytrium annulatum]|nr:hypothetical protein HK101_011400 [Irineochytrium annulatum]